MILALGLALVSASIKDRSDHLLAGSVVCPREECVDYVCVDDFRKGVASF